MTLRSQNYLPSGRKMPMGKRRELFALLVAYQDGGQRWDTSRARLCRVYELTDEDEKAIEDQGIMEDWPPLDGITK